MVIDQAKCIGCHACAVACASENRLGPGVVYRPVIEQETGTYKAITQTKSRTSGNYWLQAPYPENFVEVSAAGAWEIDGKKIAPDARRATGIHANAAMRLDPVLKNTGLVDKIGASAVFYQSPVKLVKAS